MAEVMAIAGIAAAGVQLALRLYEIGSTVVNAEEDVKYVAAHIKMYSAVLKILAGCLEENSALICKDSQGLLTQLHDESHQLFKELEEHLPRDEGIMKNFKWPFERPRVIFLVREIESLKTTANLALSVLLLAKKTKTYM
jgi:hypothetical protein